MRPVQREPIRHPLRIGLFNAQSVANKSAAVSTWISDSKLNIGLAATGRLKLQDWTLSDRFGRGGHCRTRESPAPVMHSASVASLSPPSA